MIDMPEWIRQAKGDSSDKHFVRVPVGSTFLGQIPDTRVMLRNVVLDAMMGEDAEQLLQDKYELTPLSPEVRGQLVKDSHERVGKVVGSFAVIDAVSEAVATLFVDMAPEGKVPEEVRDLAKEAQADLLRRCTLACLSALVDLGFITPNFDPVEVNFHDE